MSSTPPYRIILEPDSGGYWTAEVPAFGFVTEGRGQEGARRAAYAAIHGYIAGAKEKGLPIPKPDLQVTHTLLTVPSRSFLTVLGKGTPRPTASGRKKTTKQKGGLKKTAGTLAKSVSRTKVTSRRRKR